MKKIRHYIMLEFLKPKTRERIGLLFVIAGAAGWYLRALLISIEQPLEGAMLLFAMSFALLALIRYRKKLRQGKEAGK